jgi:3-methyl-2-oxobutanoate hydroxymethyltransferase
MHRRCAVATQVTPKFCKQYSHVGHTINEALAAFVAEVEHGAFPGAAFSPYKMKRAELDTFAAQLRERSLAAAADGAEEAAQFAGL